MYKRKLKKYSVPALMVCLTALLAVLVISDFRKTEIRMTEKSSIAMGTVISQKIYGAENMTEVTNGVCDTIEKIENVISWRIDSSEAYKLNSEAKVKIGREYADVFSACSDVYKKSGGAFDITVGKLTRMWNIGEENARVPEKKEIKKALGYVDGSKIKVSGKSVICGEGQCVDLGAVGKGLACDKVREYLETTEARSAVISVGGSILLYGENPNTGRWTVAVRNPKGEANEYIGTLSLSQGCVSTSGDYERYFEKDGKRYHHIISPETGYPADSGLISVTVVCDSGFLSDALSTACFVMGREKGEELLREYSAEGIFIDSDCNVYITDGLKDSFTLSGTGFTTVGE